MSLAGGREAFLHTDVQGLASAREPRTAAAVEGRGLLELGQAEQVAVERARRRLAAGRGGDLDVVEADDRHLAHDARVSGWERRLFELGEEHGLDATATDRLRRLLLLLAADPHASTSVREPAQAVDVHVADSLSGLAVSAVRAARRVADLGSGAGFPGLVLAAVSPGVPVTLVESVGRKAEWLKRAADALALGNVDVVPVRVEEWHPQPPMELVTARALAPLPVLVEYAAPLLAPEGTLVAWKGAPAAAEAADGRAVAVRLGLEPGEPASVTPFPGARERALYVYTKVRETPSGYPRRPGMAAKRPLRADPGP